MKDKSPVLRIKRVLRPSRNFLRAARAEIERYRRMSVLAGILFLITDLPSIRAEPITESAHK